MEMMVTSDSTPLIAISSETKTGRPTSRNPEVEAGLGRRGPPANRLITRNTATGNRMVPNAPSGSRRKILISSQVSFQSPRSMVGSLSIADRMAGQFQENVLQVGQDGA